jgi:glycosyltransferase involved in cell wall biosynthesis
VLSIVVPVYNELAVLPQCQARLRAVLDGLRTPYEVIFVDDGCSDGSSAYLVQLMCQVPSIKLIRLSRNFGKEAALSAGIDHACGDAIVVLDADLQDPPELIPTMVKAWRDGADIVCMKRRTREGESTVKRISAHLFYRLLNALSDVPIPEDTGDFRLLSRKAADGLRRLPERNRYMKGLFAWVGMPTQVIEYDRAPRAAGRSKWNYWSLFSLAIDGITSFSVKPLRCATVLGLAAALLGGFFGLWIVAKTVFFGDVVPGYPSLVAIITFFGGVQLFTIGLLGEYVGRTYIESKQRPIYLVRDVLESAVTAGSDQARRVTPSLASHAPTT